MPLYMDIHTVDSDDFSVEDVVKAHMQDLAIQDRYGVTQLKYWVNVEAKTLFCLMKGPNKEACNDVHKESHGNTACNIIEVTDDEFNLFLGEGKSVNDLAHYNSGEVDTGYRTILLLRISDLTGKWEENKNQILDLIHDHNGVMILQPDDEIMVSFIFASSAVLCADAISKILKAQSCNEFVLSLISGRPVDEQGENLFEETKLGVSSLCSLGLVNKILCDNETKSLASKEHNCNKISFNNFQFFHRGEIKVFRQVYNLLNNNILDPKLKSDEMNSVLSSSKSQTYRKIKLLTGLAPNQLIQEFRLRKSLPKLKLLNTTIAETAFDLGFESPSYFAKLFKKRFGITPKEFTKIS